MTEVIELPLRPPCPATASSLSPPLPGPDNYANDPDPLKTQVEYAVPVFGMKIDRKVFRAKSRTRSEVAPEVRERYERATSRGGSDCRCLPIQ